MANIKHVGQLANTGRKVVVVFREVPDEADSALVVDTDALTDWMHDDVINAVESPGAQAANNFYEYAQRAMFTDGSNMLQALHANGKLNKVPTSNVKMTPNGNVSIMLNELNDMIREQTGGAPVVEPEKDPNALGIAGKDVSEAQAQEYVAPAPVAEPVAEPVQTAPAMDAVPGNGDLAANLIEQAKTFETEAANLREQAYEMDPSLKPRRGRPAKPKA